MDIRSGGVGLETVLGEWVTQADHLTVANMVVVEAARALARKIDAWDVIVEFALDDAAVSGSRPAVPQHDNVSLPAFLKYCDALGLPVGLVAVSKGGSQPVPGGSGVPVNALAAFREKKLKA